MVLRVSSRRQRVALQQLRVAVRRGRGAAQELQEIERGPLARQQGPRGSIDAEQNLIRTDCLALGGAPVEAHPRIHLPEGCLDVGDAAEDRGLPRNDRGAADFLGRNERGGEITAADIFGKGRRHLLRQIGGNRHRRLVALHRLRC